MTILSARQLGVQRDLVKQAGILTYSQEDLSGMMTKILPSIKVGLKALVNYFDTTTSTAGTSLTGAQHTFLRDLQGRSYGDILTISMPVPMGLNAPYLDYLDVLEKAANFTCQEVPEILGEYSTYLAGLVSTNHAMLESMNLNVKYVRQEKDRELYTDRMAAMLNGGVIATRPIKEMIKRNADWEKVISRTDALSMRLNQVDRTALNKKIKDAYDLLELLNKRVVGGEMNQVTPEVVMHLSEGAYQLGKNFEFFSVVYYRASVLNATIAEDIRHLSDCFKNKD
jgi:hypothetical protein